MLTIHFRKEKIWDRTLLQKSGWVLSLKEKYTAVKEDKLQKKLEKAWQQYLKGDCVTHEQIVKEFVTERFI